VGNAEEGIKNISHVLNITRIYNSVCAVGHSRAALDLAWSYANKRRSFGKFLIDHPLHRKTLLEIEHFFRGGFALTFKVAEWLGHEELGKSTEVQKGFLRLFIPIAKLYTAKMSVQISSEVIEAFGGAGYIEDTGLPLLLRDAQVFPIWEGTTNILSLDLLRVLRKSPEIIPQFLESTNFSKAPHGNEILAQSHQLLSAWLTAADDGKEAQAREMAFLLAELLILNELCKLTASPEKLKWPLQETLQYFDRRIFAFCQSRR
jgi:putative acyl-CoA dehydrogenase